MAFNMMRPRIPQPSMNFNMLRRRNMYQPPEEEDQSLGQIARINNPITIPEPEPTPEQDMFEAGINLNADEDDRDDEEGDSGTGETDDQDLNIYQPPLPAGQNNYNTSFSDLFNMVQNAEPGPAEQRYSEFMSQGAPSREQFKPGKMDRLAAILGGASEGGLRGAGAGIRTAREVLERPYEQGLRDYETKAKTLGEAARIEGQTFGRKASLAKAAGTQATAQGRLQEQTRMHDELFKKWGADARARATTLQGVNYTKDETTGHLIASYRKPNGEWASWVGPKVGMTPTEKELGDFEAWKKRENIQTTNQKGVATHTSSLATEREKLLADYRDAIERGDKNRAAAIERQLITDRADAQIRVKAEEHDEQLKSARLKMRQLLEYYGADKVGQFFSYDPEDTEKRFPLGLAPGVDPRNPTYLEIFDYVYPQKKK